MRPFALPLLAALAACAGPRPSTPGAAQPGGSPSGGGPTAVSATLDSIARGYFDGHHLVGLAVGIVRNDSVVLLRGYGVMSKAGARPVTDSTIFHLASVTKPFVATAVMQLVEQGKVQLDQPVTKYIPYFKMKDPRAAKVTVRQVLTHTAGMPDVTDYGWNHPEYDQGALERYVKGLADSSLIFPPGTSWQYSNIGFELMADLVAVVSGQPFEDYVQRHILTPLKMTKSTLLMTDVDSTLLASGHESGPDSTFHLAASYPYNRRHAGSSTLHSNAIDMLRWARANLHRGSLDGAMILTRASYDSLWRFERNMTEQLTARAARAGIKLPYDSIGIGLSWMLGARNGIQVVTHSGGDNGFRSDLLLVPDRQIGIVLLTNSEPNSLHQLTFDLLDVVAR
jgi:CubicO group peptidase (beta-lactamase class C family)